MGPDFLRMHNAGRGLSHLVRKGVHVGLLNERIPSPVATLKARSIIRSVSGANNRASR
jgi:hypothetical protein